VISYCFTYSLSLCFNNATAGVGKSSLISTFVSRYFSPDVPGIMARVRLPPDPGNSCITTIIDSQGGDSAFLSAVGAATHRTPESSLHSLAEPAEGIVKEAEKESENTMEYVPNGSLENIHSIVLVYDLDQEDSFSRLEKHWLPLIQAYYKTKVSCDQALK
jgi:Ras family protein T1